ncbi:carboxypeptidase-like regulatory domain-containing protein [Acidicapsa dinghuensis]|uniref:Carboxypeptidase-like regulatory domain-containing protein n=1 Tax=Acidicapsa dinghuensis TaxID=2218256 RepID=A0ABW1E8T8_9BACT|nr:carboxypeptidase-like regulatory domain-containing protein [Acidicapsa dinghuensis]
MPFKGMLAKTWLFVALLLCCGVTYAQDASSITGTVTDTSGAVIPGAAIELTNTATGASFKATSNAEGSYTITSLPPGNSYKLTVSLQGFETFTVSDLALNVGVTRTQNVHLAPGNVVQTVAISAENANVTLDTTDASIGNNLSIEQLNELPVYDRTAGIQTLFVQQPGVDSFQGSVTGARIDQSSVTVDGLDVNDIAAANGTFAIVATAPVDSVQQFTGTVAGLTPSIGTGSGAQFQLVTKSGTNQFHGNVNEYHRDTTTVANTWFNNLNGLPRTPLIRNQFGGNLGGPIKRDKLFFFFDFADSRIIQSSTDERTVPLDVFRNGELNYINSGAGCGDSSRLSTQPQCITTLTPGQIATLDPAGIGFNPNVQSLITSRYPEANDLSRGDGVNTGGYRFTYPTPDIDTTYVGRVDYTLTSKQRIFGRFTINRENAVENLPEFATDPSTHPYTDRSYAYVISHTWAIGANKVNQFYYGDTISKYSFPDLYNPTGPDQYSFSNIDGPYTSFDGQQRRVPIPVVRDDFNWQIGAHSLTFGGTFKFIKTNSNLINNFNFVGVGLQGSALSGGLNASLRPADINQGPNNVAINDYDNLFASALGVIGDISTNFVYNNQGQAQALGGGSPRAYRYYQTEAYVGDTWRVNKKLTLSYGLRYQFYTVPYEAHGSESVPTPINLNTFINDRLAQSTAGDTSSTGLPIYSFVLGGKVNHGPDMYQPSYKDFAPRIAFAYTPYGSGKTVINGSAAIVYDRAVINSVNFLQDQVPNMFANTVTNQFGGSTVRASLATDPRVGANLAYDSTLNPAPLPVTTPYVPWIDSTGTPFGLAAGETGFVISPNLKDPYSIALNAGIQQEFPGHLIMKLNYVGRLGRRLLTDADANQVINVPDYTGQSNQTMVQAFAGLTTDLRAGGNLRTEPWFEDVLAPGTGAAVGPLPGCPNITNNTTLVACLAGQLAVRGDISDSLQTLAFYTYYEGLTGFLPTNIGIPSQFGTNAYLTNMGNSNYHGLLLTLDKNLSQGLQFEFNYTWSHSIDNSSLSSANNSLYNNSGFICDVLQPRACRGSSDFDVRQEITSNFVYALPFGRGRTFASSTPRWVDETIGGWSLSGLPSYRTGLAVTPFADAFLASFDNNDPAIFTGNSTSDLKTKVNVDHSSNTVYAFAGGADGAAKVLSEFRGPIGLEYGQRNLVRGPGAFYFDAGLAKTFPIIGDRVNLKFRADAFNLFNHPNFGTPNMNIVTNASNFGQITGVASTVANALTSDDARVAQFSLRLEF